MKPAFFPCFQMDIFKIPFSLFMNLDFLQIIFLRVFMLCRMQFSQNTNIFTNLFYSNAQQFFHIRTDVICLVCFCIQHQENIIHIHWKLLKQLIPVQNLRIFFSDVCPVFLNNKAYKKCSNTENNRADKKYRTALKTVHTGIDDIRLYKS